MGFRFKRRESTAVGARRVVFELLDDCASLLREGNAGDPDGAIHDTRRNLKRARAVLRLIRPNLAKAQFRLLDRPLRDCGRSLATSRDARVIKDTLGEFVTACIPGSGHAALTLGIEQYITPDKSELQLIRFEDLVARLGQVREVWDQTRIPKTGWVCIGPGLARTYGRCRRAAEVAAKTGTAEDLHEWRKTTKHLWHQVQLLHNAWPQILRPLAGEYGRLCGLLGRAHDLDVLDSRLAGLPGNLAEQVAPIVETMGAKRAKLARQAISLGTRLLAEEPQAFGQRMYSIWKAWKVKKAGPEAHV